MHRKLENLKSAIGETDNLIVDLARIENAEEIFEFLLQNFFPKAPVRQLGLYDESEEAKRPAWIQELIEDCLRTPYSLLVRDEHQNNRIVAVVINEMKSKTTESKSAPVQLSSKRSQSPAQIPVGRLHRAIIAEIHRNVDLFAIYETDKKMECSILAVDERYSRRGIASQLMEYSIQIARKEGAGVIWTEALSEYTAQVASKFEFETLNNIDYDQYYFEGGKLLANIPGHRIGRLMAKKL